MSIFEMLEARIRLRASLRGFAAGLRARRATLLVNDLTDRELKDIGLTRFDIDHIGHMRNGRGR
jgi:uncharacterized protein YjiS (DUF1127 family)